MKIWMNSFIQFIINEWCTYIDITNAIAEAKYVYCFLGEWFFFCEKICQLDSQMKHILEHIIQFHNVIFSSLLFFLYFCRKRMMTFCLKTQFDWILFHSLSSVMYQIWKWKKQGTKTYSFKIAYIFYQKVNNRCADGTTYNGRFNFTYIVDVKGKIVLQFCCYEWAMSELVTKFLAFGKTCIDFYLFFIDCSFMDKVS